MAGTTKGMQVTNNNICHGQFSFSTGCIMMLRLRSTTDFNNNGRVRNANNQKANNCGRQEKPQS